MLQRAAARGNDEQGDEGARQERHEQEYNIQKKKI